MSPANTMSLALSSADSLLDAKAARRLARLLNPAPAFQAHLPGGAERARVEQYIAARFREVHGANIHDFMPVLLTMGCHGRTTAATGVRAATRQPLFLEQYLSGPVEQSLGAAVGTAIPRARIAEIGNLVATQGGSSYLLFMVLTAILEQNDDIRERLKTLVDEYISVIGEAARGETACVGDKDRAVVIDLLNDIKDKGSLQLKADIDLVIEGMVSSSAEEVFGIAVEK